MLTKFTEMQLAVPSHCFHSYSINLRLCRINVNNQSDIKPPHTLVVVHVDVFTFVVLFKLLEVNRETLILLSIYTVIIDCVSSYTEAYDTVQVITLI